MKKTLIAALMGATLLAGGAVAAVTTASSDASQTQVQAQEGPRMMRDPMMRADANKDGIVTRAEMIANVDARFARMDANKDGKITAEERQAARKAMWAERGERSGKHMRGGADKERGPGRAGRPGMKRGADANGDNIVTLEEQRAHALRRFDFVDRNGDGRIEQAESQLVREMLREMGGRGRGGHRGHGGGMMSPHAPAPAAPANGS